MGWITELARAPGEALSALVDHCDHDFRNAKGVIYCKRCGKRA